MTQYDIALREGLPTDMQTLLRGFPRDGWEAHPNFARATRNWMSAHQKFRQLGAALQGDAEDFLGGRMEDGRYAERLAHGGHALVQHLHGHHSWEDHQFFPELEAADPRFARGLEMLETDHVALDGLLDTLTRQGNRVVQLATLAPDQMAEEARPMRDTLERLGGFLTRHLTDEEDLVVPIILHHKLSG